MTRLLKVLKIEVREQITEKIIKSKRHEYARGGFKLEERILRVTTAKTFALLECGHWREEHGYGAVIAKAERLSCHVCEQAEFMQKLEERRAIAEAIEQTRGNA